jgi:hypothetical protein
VGKDWLPFTHIKLFMNANAIGRPGLQQFVTLDNNSGLAKLQGDLIKISEGDSFTFMRKWHFSVVRIFRTSSKILTVADKKDAVLLKLEARADAEETAVID